MLDSRPQNQILRSQNQICGNYFLSQEILYFRGSRFSQCFVLSTAFHYLLPSKFLCWQLFWVFTNSVHFLLILIQCNSAKQTTNIFGNKSNYLGLLDLSLLGCLCLCCGEVLLKVDLLCLGGLLLDDRLCCGDLLLGDLCPGDLLLFGDLWLGDLLFLSDLCWGDLLLLEDLCLGDLLLLCDLCWGDLLLLCDLCWGDLLLIGDFLPGDLLLVGENLLEVLPGLHDGNALCWCFSLLLNLHKCRII